MEEFLAEAFRLKATDRAGWRRVPDIGRVESVADHTWGVAFLALTLLEERPDLDRGEVLTIAIAHDLAEAEVGDLTPTDYASKEEKRARERAGLDTLLAAAPEPVAKRLRDAWEAYEARATPEARFVADLDKLEMAMQAHAYARQGADPAALEEFLESARARVEDPHIRSLIDPLRSPSG